MIVMADSLSALTSIFLLLGNASFMIVVAFLITNFRVRLLGKRSESNMETDRKRTYLFRMF